MIAFSDLISKKTLADWKQSITNTSSLVGFKVTNWLEGGFSRTMLALFATLYTAGTDIVQLIAASAFLDTAEGAWLKLLAKQVFNVDAIEATYASAVDGLTLTNGSLGLFIFDAGDIVAKNHDTNKTYRNTSGGTLTPGVGHTLKVDLIAEEAGSGSTTSIGTIRELVTTFLGVTCTNEVALFGLDEESPELLRQRCRDSVAAANIGGIKKAYEFYARSAKRSDGSPIGVTRVRAMPPPGDGTLTIYVAGASGAIAGGDVAIVQALFDERVTPYGFSATVLSAANFSVTVPCTIWLPSSLGLTEAEARQAVFDALEAYVQKLPIGGTIISPATGKIYWRALLGVIEKSIDGMLKAQLTSETDTSVSAGQVPIWTGLLANTTVIQVTD